MIRRTPGLTGRMNRKEDDVNDIEKAIFLDAVRSAVASDPSLCRGIIDYATEGVKDFADKQSDIGTKAAFRLICVLEQTPVPQDGKFGVFTAGEVIDALEPCFGGTPALATLRKKFDAANNPIRLSNKCNELENNKTGEKICHI